MNPTLDLIMKRFTCRAYTGEPVSNEHLDLIAKAALAAPTAMNRQPYRVIVIRDKAWIEELDAQGMAALKAMPDQSAYNRFMERGGTLFYNAPVMFMLAIEKGAQTDLGIVAQNIVLAAASLGLDTCHCGMARLIFENGNKEKYEKQLGFPEGYEFGLAVLVGRGAMEKAPHELDMGKLSFIG